MATTSTPTPATRTLQGLGYDVLLQICKIVQTHRVPADTWTHYEGALPRVPSALCGLAGVNQYFRNLCVPYMFQSLNIYARDYKAALKQLERVEACADVFKYFKFLRIHIPQKGPMKPNNDDLSDLHKFAEILTYILARVTNLQKMKFQVPGNICMAVGSHIKGNDVTLSFPRVTDLYANHCGDYLLAACPNLESIALPLHNDAHWVTPKHHRLTVGLEFDLREVARASLKRIWVSAADKADVGWQKDRIRYSLNLVQLIRTFPKQLTHLCIQTTSALGFKRMLVAAGHLENLTHLAVEDVTKLDLGYSPPQPDPGQISMLFEVVMQRTQQAKLEAQNLGTKMAAEKFRRLKYIFFESVEGGIVRDGRGEYLRTEWRRFIWQGWSSLYRIWGLEELRDEGIEEHDWN